MPRGISQIDDSARQNPAYSSSHSITQENPPYGGFSAGRVKLPY